MNDTTETMIETALHVLSSGNNHGAISILEDAVLRDPQSSAAFRALAEAHLRSGCLDDARRCCQQSITINPHFDRAYYLLGVTCAHAADLDESIAAFERAIELRPDYFDAIRALAAVAGRSDNLTRALECYRCLVENRIDHSEVLLEYAETAERHGAIDEAIATREVLLQRDPSDLANRFNLSSLNGKDPPSIAPASLVTKTFDDYAEKFETHLGNLGYSGPEFLCNAVNKHESRTDLRVLDLGCGTGLCGQKFRSIAGHLVGIDLSTQMLEKAKGKNIYDRLICSDLIDFFSAGDRFDLMIAGDVLIYIGDLLPIFTAARESINSGGHFAFTIERGETQEIAVSRSHRYVHSAAYVRRIVTESGWRVVEFDESTFRQENHQEIPGLVVVVEPC